MFLVPYELGDLYDLVHTPMGLTLYKNIQRILDHLFGHKIQADHFKAGERKPLYRVSY